MGKKLWRIIAPFIRLFVFLGKERNYGTNYVKQVFQVIYVKMANTNTMTQQLIGKGLKLCIINNQKKGVILINSSEAYTLFLK